jgi:hypothetical protein
MSLSILAPLPDWRQKAEQLQRDLYERNRQLEEAEAALRAERQRTAIIEQGVSELRTVLAPVYQGLRHIFGEIDAMGVGSVASASTGTDPRKAAVWEDWKTRLGGFAAKAIDALLLHGELSTDQMMIHLRTSRRQTVHDTVHKMNKAGIIIKRDGRVSLKEL